jgi:hypothetical protein
MIKENARNLAELDAILTRYGLTCDFAGNVNGPDYYGYKCHGPRDTIIFHLWKRQ